MIYHDISLCKVVILRCKCYKMCMSTIETVFPDLTYETGLAVAKTCIRVVQARGEMSNCEEDGYMETLFAPILQSQIVCMPREVNERSRIHIQNPLEEVDMTIGKIHHSTITYWPHGRKSLQFNLFAYRMPPRRYDGEAFFVTSPERKFPLTESLGRALLSDTTSLLPE